jgi:predicted DNA-binding transcriptional regulator AlpA
MPKNKNLDALIQPEPITGDRLLTIQETAYLTSLAVSTLNRARVYGTNNAPPFVKLGKSVRYRMTTVQNWIAGQPEYQHTTQQQAAA